MTLDKYITAYEKLFPNRSAREVLGDGYINQDGSTVYGSPTTDFATWMANELDLWREKYFDDNTGQDSSYYIYDYEPLSDGELK